MQADRDCLAPGPVSKSERDKPKRATVIVQLSGTEGAGLNSDAPEHALSARARRNDELAYASIRATFSRSVDAVINSVGRNKGSWTDNKTSSTASER